MRNDLNEAVCLFKAIRKLSKVGGNNETCYKDAFGDGEIKLTRSLTKIDGKTISGRTICLCPLCPLVRKEM